MHVAQATGIKATKAVWHLTRSAGAGKCNNSYEELIEYELGLVGMYSMLTLLAN